MRIDRNNKPLKNKFNKIRLLRSDPNPLPDEQFEVLMRESHKEVEVHDAPLLNLKDDNTLMFRLKKWYENVINEKKH